MNIGIILIFLTFGLDPLGALWPFIGILCEAIVLAVIILGSEYFRKKKADSEDGQGKSCLKSFFHAYASEGHKIRCISPPAKNAPNCKKSTLRVL